LVPSGGPSAVRSLYCLHSADILEFSADLLQLFGALGLEAYGQGRDPVLAGHRIDFQNIDISLKEILKVAMKIHYDHLYQNTIAYQVMVKFLKIIY